jgi:hypothetical protein
MRRRGGRGHCAALALPALLALLALLLSAPAAAAEDELVPEGVWQMRVGLARHTETEAFNHNDARGPLLNYLVPDDSVRGELTGGVTRQVEHLGLNALYGLSDTWNLALGLPYVRIDQTSTLNAPGSPSQAALDQVTRLQTQTIQGPGRLHLGSLHRPVFTDRHSLVLGYGVDLPVDAPASRWAGRGTLLLDSPTSSVFGLLHYTFYPYTPRTHVDLRLQADVSVTRRLTLLSGQTSPVNPGNDLLTTLGYSREFGPIATEVSALVLVAGQSKINGTRQGDGVTGESLRVMLGYGNLVDLEQGPIAFPYQLQLSFEETLHGSELPIKRELQLSLQFYF